MRRAALLSRDGTYRYRLARRWNERPHMVWIMLNPSTADDQVDDPTIRRCIGFAQGWGFGGLIVYNLFALRATDPKALLEHPDPVGPENAQWLEEATRPTIFPPHQPPMVVGAWGAHRAAQALLRQDVPRAAEVVEVLRCLRVRCLGATKDGSPKHPLYLPATAQLQPWPVAGRACGVRT